MESKHKKKYLTSIGIFVFTLLVIGATYAYFSVDTQNNFGTVAMTGRANGIGTVLVSGNNASLLLNLTAADMMNKGRNVTYYASSSGRTTTSTVETIGVASVSPTTDTNSYHCTYTLEVSHTGTVDMYDKFNQKTNDIYDYTNRSAGQIILTLNGVDYDFTGEWPGEVEGSFYISGSNTVNITAGLRIVNSSTIDQIYLAGSDISLSITLKTGSLTCTI